MIPETSPATTASAWKVREERRLRSIEFGYRVCGRFEGEILDGGVPRVCVMPRGHRTSPHRDIDGCDFDGSHLEWPE